MYQEVRNEKKVNWKQFIERKNIIVAIVAMMMGVLKLPSGATPFGLAMLGAIADTGFPLVIPMVLTALTTGIAFGWVCFLKYVISAIIYVFMRSFLKGNTKMGSAAKILFATAIAEVIVLLGTETIIYDAVMAAFMSTTTTIFYLVFSEGFPILLDYDEQRISSHETLMAAGILITVLTCGIGNFAILHLFIRNIICIFVVLFLGWRRGTACGVLTGLSVSLVLGIMGYASASTVATYAICGLLAGVLSRYGKLGAIVGFVIGNAVWAFYSNASTEIIIPIGEIVVASLLLFFLPKRVTHWIDNLFDMENTIEGNEPRGYLTESTIYKLKSVSEVAEDMAANVESETQTEQSEMTRFVKHVKENACEKCVHRETCEEHDAHSIYETCFHALEGLKNQKRISNEELSIPYCKNASALFQGLESASEMYLLNHEWQSKVKEDKKLVAQQLRGVSQAIDHVQQEMNVEEQEKPLLGAGYQIAYAFSAATKSGSKISGDSVKYVQLKNGKMLIGISDGMGSGELAAKSSQKVLTLLEKYCNTGLEKKVAFDMINAYMMLGDHQDHYATLDVLLYDTTSSKAEMLKCGACPTYMLKEGMVKMISSKSLPIGATAQASAEVFSEQIERDTILIMVPDGVVEGNRKKEKGIKEILEKVSTNNLQRISDIILQEAIDAEMGIAKDDMSVVALKIS